MPKRRYDLNIAWAAYLDGAKITSIAKQSGVKPNAIRVAFDKYYTVEFNKLKQQRQFSQADLQEAWHTYKNNVIGLVKLASRYGISPKTLRNHFNKFPEYFELAEHRKLLNNTANGHKVSKLPSHIITQSRHKSRLKASKSLLMSWQADKADTIKAAIRKKYPLVRFRNEVQADELNDIVNKFKNHVTLVRIAEEHQIGVTILSVLIKSVIDDDQYKKIAKQTHSISHQRKNKVVLTKNTGKKVGQPGNKKSKSLRSKHINHSMPVIK